MIKRRRNYLPFMSIVKNMSQAVCVSCCLVVFASNNGAMADVSVANGYTWQHTANMYTDEAWILGVEPEPSGAVEVPERLGGCRVTKIHASPYVFSGRKKLESVKLPNGVKSLDGAVFDGCSGLRQVDISPSTQMSSLAFRGCESLQDAQGLVVVNEWLFGYYGTSSNVVVPDGVACIDNGVFKNSTRLTSISLPNGLRNIGESAFYGCKGLATVELPSSLTNISHHAFYGCSKLGSVIIPGGVLDVQREVFASCTGLATVEIKSGIQSVGYEAFQSCSGLQSVTIPEGVQIIDESAFQGCTRLRSITIPSTVDTVEAFAFADCSAMISVSIGNGVRFLESYAFRDCKSLGGIDIPDSVTDLGSGVFKGCSSLKSVRLPQNIVELPWGCFYDNAMLTDITLPRSLKKISRDVFHNCSSLETLEMNEGIESIGLNAFAGCKRLITITIPSTVREIEGSVLQGCDSLESINVASGNADYKSVNNCLVDMTGSRLVDIPYGCTTVVIPDGITEIPANAFYYDVKVEGIQIPDSVNLMGYNAISSCAKLKSITIPGSLYEIGKSCISGCGSLESVVLCEGVCSIADGAFYYCPKLSSIEIPSTLSYVGAAFTSCNNLKTVYVHENDRARVEQLLANTYLKNLNITYQDVSAEKQIIVTLNAMGGSVDESCVTRAAGAPIGDLPSPKRSGYEFLGWFSEATGGTKVSATTVVSADMTLYAHWLQNIVCYAVSFNANGGSCSTTSRSYESGSALGTLPSATRSGYTFDGWYTAASGGTKVTASTVVRGDMTLYAHWEEIGGGGDDPVVPVTPTIKFDDSMYGWWAEDGESEIWGYYGDYGADPESVDWADDFVDVKGSKEPGTCPGEGYAFPVTITPGATFTPQIVEASTDATFATVSMKTDAEMLAMMSEPTDEDGARWWVGHVWSNGRTDSSRAWVVVFVTDVPKGDDCYTFDLTTKPIADGSKSMMAYAQQYGATLPDTLEIPKSISFKVGIKETGEVFPERLWALYNPANNTQYRAAVNKVDASGGDSAQFHTPGLWLVTQEMIDEQREAIVIADPIVNPPDGTVFKGDSCTVTITCATEGAEIYYTSNGRTPRIADANRYTGPFTISDTATIVAVAVKGGKASEYVEATITKVIPEPLTLAGVLDELKLADVTTGGDAEWLPIEDETAKVGGACVVSGALGDDGEEEATWLEANVYGKGTLIFWWRVSCEPDPRSGKFTYDFAAFEADGEVVVKKDGESDWMQVTKTFTTDGEHVIRWIYNTDGWPSDDYDGCVWVDGVTWSGSAAPEEQTKPTIEGDEGATVTGDADTGFVVKPSEGKTAVEVTIPQGVDAAKVTVEVSAKVASVKSNGAKVKVVSGGADITEYLNMPVADGDGVIDLTKATVKEEIVKEAMDAEKGAKIVLDAANPSLTTPNTRVGLFYQLREGVSIEGMANGDSTIGDGNPWSPEIKVKGGNSAFYSIGVGKGE